MRTIICVLLLSFAVSAHAFPSTPSRTPRATFDRNMQILRDAPEDIWSVQGFEGETSEFNPFAPDAEQSLEAFDEAYRKETGEGPFDDLSELEGGCYRESCPVFAYINREAQTLTLYLGGQVVDNWLVSTGMPGFETPQLDQHASSRIYTKYSSTKFPGGDYQGLGNMPFAVFIQGGIAIHGTPRGNWRLLGRPASHGCIRLHPSHAEIFNRLVRENGSRNVWVLVY